LLNIIIINLIICISYLKYYYICFEINNQLLDKDIIIQGLIKKLEIFSNRLEVLEKEIVILKKENFELKKRLSHYETPKNSNNSSIPPSKDENRPKRTSLREQTGRKPGGQLGRDGNTLQMVATPDVIQKHIPQYCQNCGKDIENITSEFVCRRQVFDIPTIEIKSTEHQIYKKVCSCGHTTKSTFPAGVNTPVSYGTNIESLIGYFHSRQYIPFKRAQEIFRDIFNVPISEGGIHYLLHKLVKKAYPAYQMIKQKLLPNSTLPVGSDETGVKVGGDKHWAWVWQNEKATFITITDNRAGKSITKTFKDGFKNSVLVHDCWKSHFNTDALTHQICIAHLLRDLNYLSEKYNHKWSKVCKNIFKSALDLKKSMNTVDYYMQNPRRMLIEKRMDKLLKYNLPTGHKELISFQKRLIKYKDYLFPFLYHPKVPPDNNASERAIRNIKVKQKVSGQFKSPVGAFGFAALRSVTDTIIKNNQNVLNSLRIIANLHTD